MDIMDVSVVIINYNTFAYTTKCIESIISNTEGINYEIILVDNASTERDPNDFKKEFPEIKLIANKENSGFAKGNNIGLSHAKGKYVFLLNSDTELIDNAFKIGYDYLENNKNVGVLSGQLLSEDGSLQHNCQRFPSIKYKLLELFRLHKLLPHSLRAKILLNGYFDHDKFVKPDWVWGTFFMMPRVIVDAFPEKKLFENFFMYIEDLQWCFYIRKKLKKEIHFIPEIKVKHLMGGSSGFKKEILEKNLNIFINDSYPFFKRNILKILDN